MINLVQVDPTTWVNTEEGPIAAVKVNKEKMYDYVTIYFSGGLALSLKETVPIDEVLQKLRSPANPWREMFNRAAEEAMGDQT